MKYDKIESLGEYISYMEKLQTEQEYMLFRGECRDYGDTSCMPNIFRKGYLDKNDFFEKNILDEMTANKIAEGTSYIEKAINAQHGGFASRLLDVSYNCLVALYFAITPFYIKPELDSDSEDGCVYIFFTKELFCSASGGIADNYDAIVKKDQKWYTGTFLFNRNFKVIDHVKLNSRIIAQQGAFILFPGDEAEKIPSTVYKKIIIDQKAKPQLREDLKKLFGIDTGSMYPEINNCVQNITEKSQKINSNEFNLSNELAMVFLSAESEIETFYIKIIQNKDRERIIRNCEKRLLWYKKGFEELKLCIGENKTYEEELANFKYHFNKCVNDFYSWCKKYTDDEFEFCSNETLIGGGKDENKQIF